MLSVIERYLQRIGSVSGAALLLTFLVWFSIVLGVAVYAIGAGVLGLSTITAAALDGGAWQIGGATVAWLFIIPSAFLSRAIYQVWREYRNERWQADVALCQVERELFSIKRKPGGRDGPRERLAVRTLESIEGQILGAVQPAELTIEERLVALGRATGIDANDDRPSSHGTAP